MAMKDNSEIEFSEFNFSMDDEVIGILYVSVLKKILEAKGYRLKAYGGCKDSLSNYRKRVSPSAWFQILEKSLAEVPGGIGFCYGGELNLIAADTVGQLIMSSSNLNQAFQSLKHFNLLLSLSLKLDVKVEGSVSIIQFKGLYPLKYPIPEYIKWFLVETFITCVVQQAKWLTGNNIPINCVRLPYDRPAHDRDYESYFNCDISYGHSVAEVEIDTAILDMPVLTANEQIRTIKAEQCQAVLNSWKGQFSIKDRVKAILVHTYPNFPTLEELAKHLNTSRSCLYRKLQESETNYQALINEFKKGMSIRLLRETNLSAGDIAEKMGFSDASSFRRAFKAWTGLQPSFIRNQAKETRSKAKVYTLKKQASLKE